MTGYSFVRHSKLLPVAPAELTAPGKRYLSKTSAGLCIKLVQSPPLLYNESPEGAGDIFVCGHLWGWDFMKIAVPRERAAGERRVALTPDAVGKLVKAGQT